MVLNVRDEFKRLGGIRGVLDAVASPATSSETFHGNNGPYLTRYELTAHSDGWKTVVNHFHRGDEDEELHSHPWVGTSLILFEGYTERRLTTHGDIRMIRYVEGDLVPLNEGLYHRVSLEGPSCWTLLVHGPSTRDWDFLDVKTGKKTPWREFIQQKGLKPLEPRS
jgi:hypothetical protein